MKKAALQNLGCKVNAYETESMEQMLIEAGYEIVSFHDQADVYVINTCSVTNIADRKSRQMIHRAKKMNPDSIVIAAGCYVQTSTKQAEEDPDIDIIVELMGREQIRRLPILENGRLCGMVSLADLAEQQETRKEAQTALEQISGNLSNR